LRIASSADVSTTITREARDRRIQRSHRRHVDRGLAGCTALGDLQQTLALFGCVEPAACCDKQAGFARAGFNGIAHDRSHGFAFRSSDLLRQAFGFRIGGQRRHPRVLSRQL
jgi:hypothetical protein